MALTPHLSDPDFELYLGDALDVLRQLPDQHVHCIVTSPPYWGLRNYDVEGQVGLEATPQEYIAKMVEIFAEARRVLRNDGTLWLNLGDSYASNWGSGRKASWISSNSGEDEGRGWGVQTALPPNMWRGTTIKPKDLVGIPWSVALALRESYYKGQIKEELDRVWLAAMIDAEGSIDLNCNRTTEAKTNNRKKEYFGASLKIFNTNENIVKRCAEIVGVGSVGLHDTRRQSVYSWSVYGDNARQVLREIYPHLVAKQDQARLVIGCPSANEDDKKKAWESLKALHKGQPACIDFSSPEGMWEKGWYLRQDIIWEKPDPMPESVRDRCTTSHEHVFLLTKKPSYYFDQEAIREPYKYDGRKITTVTGRDGSVQHRDGERWPGTGRNKRSVWKIPTQNFADAHFATFPEALIEPMILAGCPEGGTVLDCFSGAGTTALVARKLGRKSIGIELSPEYCQLAAKRLAQLSLLA